MFSSENVINYESEFWWVLQKKLFTNLYQTLEFTFHKTRLILEDGSLKNNWNIKKKIFYLQNIINYVFSGEYFSVKSAISSFSWYLCTFSYIFHANPAYYLFISLSLHFSWSRLPLRLFTFIYSISSRFRTPCQFSHTEYERFSTFFYLKKLYTSNYFFCKVSHKLLVNYICCL